MTRIYLAGPIAHTDDPNDWRQELIDEHSTVEFANPLDEYTPADASNPHLHDDIVDSDKQQIEASDALLVGYEAVRSVGTTMEVLFAYERDIPVAILIRDDSILSDLSPWYHYHSEFITSKPGHAVAYLEREL
jgi:nucleoside 2-deoxyribosyltransferase